MWHGFGMDWVMLPFAAGIGVLVLLGFLLTLYVLYDVLLQQPEMVALEKLVWIVVVLSFNIFGVIAYLFLVKQQQSFLLPRYWAGNRTDELQQLHELKETGALTEQEYETEKQRLLGHEDE